MIWILITETIKADQLIAPFEYQYQSSTDIRWAIRTKISDEFIGTCDSNSWREKMRNATSGLRNMILSTKPDSIGINLKAPSEVWGVVMETGYPEAVATLVVLANGTASIYFSNGGGIIGHGSPTGPHRAGQLLLESSQQFTKEMKPTKSYAMPAPSIKNFAPNKALQWDAPSASRLRAPELYVEAAEKLIFEKLE